MHWLRVILERLPGVPHAGTTEAQQFSLSFWASVYSGVVYSLFTGLFVGLAVWWVQKYADDRRLRASYRGELVLFQQQLWSALRQPSLILVEPDARKTEPAASSAIAILLEKHPVPVWRETLREPAALFAAIDFLRVTHGHFEEAASNLDLVLRGYFRQLNDKRGLHAGNDPPRIAYTLGRLQGGAPEAVKPWLGGIGGDIPSLEADFSAFKSSPETQLSVGLYLAARADLVNAAEAVRKALTDASQK